MTAYEQQQEDKRQRLLDAAGKATARSNAAHARAQEIASYIPFGQPILVGHHSERHHRADLKRIDNGYRKAFEESDRAKELERRAEAVGTGGISSDDPAAIGKLEAKIQTLEHQRGTMKKINRAHARYLKNPSVDLSGFAPEIALKIKDYKPAYSWEPHPYPPYSFQNLGGRIRQAKKRVEQLKAAEGDSYTSTTRNGVTVIEDPSINRLQMIFNGKPSAEVLKRLKLHGFHYTRQKIWQRQLNNSARYAATEIMKAVETTEEATT